MAPRPKPNPKPNPKPETELAVIGTGDISAATTLAIAKLNEFEAVVKEVETFAGASVEKDGIERVSTALSVTVKARTSIDKSRKAIIEPALEFQRKVNEAAKVLQARVEVIETPLKKQVDDHEKAEALKVAEQRLEAERRASTRAARLTGLGTSHDYYALRDMSQPEFDELVAKAQTEFDERNRQAQADAEELAQLRALRAKVEAERAAAVERENGVTMPGQTPPNPPVNIEAATLEASRHSVAMVENSPAQSRQPNTPGSTRPPSTHFAIASATVEQNVDAYLRGVQEFNETFFREDPESPLAKIVAGRFRSFAMFIRGDVKNRETF